MGVFENFAKLTGNHLCQSLFLKRVGGLRPATLLKKRPWLRCFPVNFANFQERLFNMTTLDECFCSEISLKSFWSDSWVGRFSDFI